MGALIAIEVLKSFARKRMFIPGHTGFKGSWLSFKVWWLVELWTISARGQ